MLDLNKYLADLNVKISQVNEGLMFPSAPFAGTVERVFVHPGQVVNPGIPLLVLRGDVNTASAIILASADIASNVSRFEPTQFTIGSAQVPALPRAVAQEPTDGSLLAITYTLPKENTAQLTNGSYITADVPVGTNYLKADDPFVPLDAVYQTQDNSYVLVAEKQGDKLIAKNRTVTVGQVFGEFVDVTAGVKPGDQVILDRNVIEGDVVNIK